MTNGDPFTSGGNRPLQRRPTTTPAQRQEILRRYQEDDETPRQIAIAMEISLHVVRQYCGR
jgi:DNA-binding CsgD family transcriptional regulator